MEEAEATRRDGFVGRMEVVSGRTGRRRWPDEVKARIVRESLAPGVRVGEVAQRYGMAPQQLTQWRRAAREGLLALADDCDAGAPAFVPLGVGDATEETLAQPIEIVAGRIVVRLPGTASAARIAEVAAALGTRF